LSRRSDGHEYEEDEFNDEEDDEKDLVYIEIAEILNHGQIQLQMEGDEEHEQNISIGKEDTGEGDIGSDNEESQIRLPRHFRCVTL
jgi:hypothetical protein